MAAKWTADWVNRLFILKAGVTEIDVQVDLYSDWKEEVQLSDNMKHPIAMRNVGGDPISDVQNLGATYFLINGWRIRPQEANHELTITGNLFSDPAGENIVVPTLGNYTVLVTNVVSNLVDSSVARLDLDQLQRTIFLDTVNGVAWNGTDTETGTPSKPVNNITDARAIADSKNIDNITIRNSSVTLDQNYDSFVFIGEGNSTLDFGGYNIQGCQFLRLFISGTCQGGSNPAKVPLLEECTIGSLVDWAGTMVQCVLTGTVQIATSPVFGINCYNCVSGIAGPNSRPIFDCGGGNINIAFRQYTGGLQIEDLAGTSQCSIDLVAGQVILDSTVTGGDIILRGIGDVTNNATGTANVVDKLVQGDDVSLTRKILSNQMTTDPGTGILTIYDDDGTVLLTAQLFEDTSGVQTYRGQGAERRNKLS